MDAAKAEGDERPEQRIVGDANHRLDAAGDHRLDEDAVDVGVASRGRGRARGCRRRRDSTAASLRQIQPHARRRRSCATRCATPASPPPGSRARAPARPPRRPSARACPPRAAGRTRRARARASSPVSQPFAARVERPPADRARLVDADVVEAPEQRRRLRAPLGVSGDLAERARGVFRKRVGRARARRRHRAAAAGPARHHDRRAPVCRVAPARAAGGDAVANRLQRLAETIAGRPACR